MGVFGLNNGGIYAAGAAPLEAAPAIRCARAPLSEERDGYFTFLVTFDALHELV